MKFGMIDDPRVHRFAQEAEETKPWAVGSVEMLYQRAAQFHADGCIGWLCDALALIEATLAVDELRARAILAALRISGLIEVEKVYVDQDCEEQDDEYSLADWPAVFPEGVLNGE